MTADRVTNFGMSFRIADDLQKFPMGPFAWITPSLNRAGHWVISTRTREGSPIADFTITDAELEAVADWTKGHFERRRKYIAERERERERDET
jgi:hypothetical protein